MRVSQKAITILASLILLGLATGYNYGESTPLAISPEPCELAVLANTSDPYYPLAEEIARVENAPLAHNIQEAMDCQPVFLLWVVSPGFLSDAVMIEYSLAMKDSPLVISSGIITASTMEGARELWQRHAQVQAMKFVAVNAPNPAAHLDTGQIIELTQGLSSISPLTRSNFMDVIQTADYLTFTGHGGSNYLRLDEYTVINSGDVPKLNKIVIGTGSCQTVRPWRTNSIALRFIDQGAAAYAGFVYSPNEGYLIGEFDGLPFRYTWSEFPIGHVIQAQSRGTLQGFAQIPHLFLLGDPRIALQSNPPYRLVTDSLEDKQRTLVFENVPAGVIPIYIAGGAAYHFVEASGITAAAEQDPFYNSRLQMVNILDDKFILLVHTGGDLTLRLRLKTPWYWFIGDILLDSLDHTYVFSQQSGGDVFAIGFAAIPLTWAGWQIIKKRISWQKLRVAMILGASVATIQTIYVLVRLDEVTITSKIVIISPLSILASLILTICGILIFFQARSGLGRVIAVGVMTFISWATAVGLWIALALINQFSLLSDFGTALYNYSPSLLALGSFVLTLILSGLVLMFLGKFSSLLAIKPQSRIAEDSQARSIGDK
ncbi:MAG: hypothetical protein JW726_08320 [Anaerolineales bacterium]|nr:hypothetical protein [Anaerolineales bacterium]